jgi:DNA (cytosine-5)-methyltransferase 1
MFPEAIRAIRELSPKAFIFENVKGLITKAHAESFAYLYLQLNYPEIDRSWKETWKSHRTRLEKHHTGSQSASTYKVIYQTINAADFGVPQKRERVFIVGLRSDLGVEWSFPAASHSLDALLVDQWATEAYWRRHGLSAGHRATMLPRLRARLARAKKNKKEIKTQPWKTVRDAISDLPEPGLRDDSGYPNHVLVPGARSYLGHSGSPFDFPAKTVKAGDHGVGGGENALKHLNGKVRYFTVRELARLQTFPDDFAFQGSWGQILKQLGNAVPVRLAQVIGQSVRDALEKKTKKPN